MGFARELFAEAVDPDFECKLCGQVLEEPLCTPCGHVFCTSCLLPWAARWRLCPLQCQPLAPGELYRVLPLRSLIHKLRIRCDNRARGCGRSIPLQELAAHVEHCDFGPSRRRRWGYVPGPSCGGGKDVPARGGLQRGAQSRPGRERAQGAAERQLRERAGARASSARLEAAWEGAAGRGAAHCPQVPGKVHPVHGSRPQLHRGPERQPRPGKPRGVGPSEKDRWGWKEERFYLYFRIPVEGERPFLISRKHPPVLILLYYHFSFECFSSAVNKDCSLSAYIRIVQN